MVYILHYPPYHRLHEVSTPFEAMSIDTTRDPPLMRGPLFLRRYIYCRNAYACGVTSVSVVVMIVADLRLTGAFVNIVPFVMKA